MTFSSFSQTALMGLARHEAPLVMSSEEIEQRLPLRRLKLPAGLLETLTGIRARRLYPASVKPSEAAALAAEKLLAETAFPRRELDLLYCTSVCRDHLEPSTASIVQSRLKLGGRVKSLDLGSACLGFIDGLELAALAIDSGQARYALVVDGENSHPIVLDTLERLSRPEAERADFYRHFATLTLGSGAAAALLGPLKESHQAPRLAAMVSRSDAEANALCRGDAGGMETDSTALMNAGVRLAAETFEAGQSRFGWRTDSFSHFICHQVSAVNIKKLCQRLALDESRLPLTYPEYGNMGPAAIPFTLDLAWRRGDIKKGDRLCLMGIGSGLCCGMMELIC